jgi:hypothetical protein
MTRGRKRAESERKKDRLNENDRRERKKPRKNSLNENDQREREWNPASAW